MEIRNLITFLKVTELHNFSKAAEALDYSQSAVTVQIQQLEKELGVKLFDRIGKNVNITQYGRDFIGYARDVVAAVSRATSFATERTELSGQVTVGTIESLLTASFTQILPEFHELYPKVHTSIYVGPVADIAERLAKNELDVIYTLDEQTLDSQYVRLLEEESDIVIVTNSDNPLAKRPSLTLKELVNEPFVLLDKNTRYRKLFDQELAQKGLEILPFLEMDSVIMLLRLVRENASYLTVVPRYAAERSIHGESLTILPVEDCNLHQWRQVLYHKNKVITPQIQGMIDVILKHANKPL